MGFRRVFIIRKDLHLSAGKLAAMVGHCAEAYWTNQIRKGMTNAVVVKGNEHIHYSLYLYDKVKNGEVSYYTSYLDLDKGVYEEYICNRFVKTICEARNKNHLLKAKKMAEELDLVEDEDFGLIHDACFTELTPEEDDGTTLVGIWFKPLPDELIQKISKKYQLYRD